MTLYQLSACSAMQMESGICSDPVEMFVICNPLLRTYELLYGINSMKDLDLNDPHKTDVVEDPVGRPFRKYSHKPAARALTSGQLGIVDTRWMNRKG